MSYSQLENKLALENRELRAEIERLATELDEEEKTVFAAMKMLKERDAEIERLKSDIRALSRTLNGIANRSDFADKVLEAAHKGRERGQKARRALEGK